MRKMHDLASLADHDFLTTSDRKEEKIALCYTICLGRLAAELTNCELILIRSRVLVALVLGLSSFVSGTVNVTLIC